MTNFNRKIKLYSDFVWSDKCIVYSIETDTIKLGFKIYYVISIDYSLDDIRSEEVLSCSCGILFDMCFYEFENFVVNNYNGYTYNLDGSKYFVFRNKMDVEILSDKLNSIIIMKKLGGN